MNNIIHIKEYNLCVVDLWSILDESYDDISDNFAQYNIQVKTKISSDVKNLCLHYIILHVCRFIVQQKSGVKVIFYYDPVYTSSLLHMIVPHTFLQKCIKKVAALLPIKLYNIEDMSFANYSNIINTDNNGSQREYILKLIAYNNKIDFSSFTFNKTMSYIKRHNLYLLNKQLLTDLKAKQLLLV